MGRCTALAERSKGLFLFQLSGDVFVAGLFTHDLPFQDCALSLENLLWLLSYFCGGSLSAATLRSQLASVLAVISHNNSVTLRALGRGWVSPEPSSCFSQGHPSSRWNSPLGCHFDPGIYRSRSRWLKRCSQTLYIGCLWFL